MIPCQVFLENKALKSSDFAAAIQNSVAAVFG